MYTMLYTTFKLNSMKRINYASIICYIHVSYIKEILGYENSNICIVIKDIFNDISMTNTH